MFIPTTKYRIRYGGKWPDKKFYPQYKKLWVWRFFYIKATKVVFHSKRETNKFISMHKNGRLNS